MQFRLHDRITIVNASGPDIDRSAAGRLAAETAAWLPQALTPQAGATWQPINDHRATVTIPGPSGPADIDLTIDHSGRLADIHMKRWNDSTKPPSYQPFGGTINDSTTVDDVTIAASGSVGWDHNTPAQADGVFFEYQIVQARFLYPTGPDPAPGKDASSTEAARSAVQPHTHE